MINNISSWAEQVIIAVIIATIIEIILPKGNSKKYIKTIIGIYILYTIISPVLSFINGGEIKIDYSKYEDYFTSAEEYKVLEKELNSVTAKSIEDTYTKELEKQIKQDLEEMNLKLENISLHIDLETGEIIYLKLNVKNSKEQSNTNNISVNKIEIGTSKVKSSLSKQEINNLKSTLQEKYSIDYEKITINSI